MGRAVWWSKRVTRYRSHHIRDIVRLLPVVVSMFVRVAPEHEQMETGPSKTGNSQLVLDRPYGLEFFSGLGWLARLRRMTISRPAIGTPHGQI